MEEGQDQLAAAFLAGIREELSSIEENENNIEGLSQVFRYYAKYAGQLSQVLYDFAARQCFPWELIHALHLLDDILLMDNTGRYKAEFSGRLQGLLTAAFQKAQSDKDRREVARMLHAWRGLKIFDLDTFEATRSAICDGDPAIATLLDEADMVDEDEPLHAQATADVTNGFAAKKRRRVIDNNIKRSSVKVGERCTLEPVEEKPSLFPNKVLLAVERIIDMPAERPFEMLGVDEDKATGHEIRKAYRRVALLIHPDKNPGLEVKCQEALIKLQQSREQAEEELRRMEAFADTPRVDARSTAAEAANSTIDTAFRCKYPSCELPPCKQCANGCCTRNITHCHTAARSKGGLQCFFHPPPRAWARNA